MPDRRAVIKHLWHDHLEAPFPDRLRGEEIAGVDMVMLDADVADVAGIVTTWLGSTGSRNPDHEEVAQALQRDFELVLPELTNAGEQEYYTRLRTLLSEWQLSDAE